MEQTSILSGKTALVTGGSRGIGAGIVRRLAADGANVVFTYTASTTAAQALVREIESAGGKALAIQADSLHAEQVRKAVQETVMKFGSLEIFVNSAGILALGSIEEFSLADFDRIVAINVRAAFVGMQAAAKVMKEGARIILIGSNMAVRTAFPGASIYSMTKAALTGLVRGAAIDLAPRGITVNNVQPGPIQTAWAAGEGPNVDFIKSVVPLKRLGTVEEVAGLVAYLSTPLAAFITGSSLTMDGGVIA